MQDSDKETTENQKGRHVLPPGPGRPKGVPNKRNAILRDLIMDIHKDLENKGKGLTECAKQNPKWFYENFIKPMLPKEISLDPETAETIVNIMQFGKGKDGDNPSS